MMKVHEGLAEAQSAFKALVEAANSEILKKERSAQTSTQLLQTRQADVEGQLAGVTQQLQELPGLVGQVDSNRVRNEQMLGQVEGRIKQMLDDGQVRKELREIASAEAGTPTGIRCLRSGCWPSARPSRQDCCNRALGSSKKKRLRHDRSSPDRSGGASPPLLPGLWAFLVVDRIPLQAATVPPPCWAEQ